MNSSRRAFIKTAGLAATSPWIWFGIVPTQASANTMTGDQLLNYLTEINDGYIDGQLALQLDRPGDRWDGGVTNVYEIPNEHSTLSFFVRLANSYVSRYSHYHLSSELEGPMERAMACLVNVQHEDGTIDLYSTNFHSTPDAAFLVNAVSPAYAILKQLNRPGMAGAMRQLETFLKNAARALAVGGIHTPNHRWVVCAALARVHSFWPSQKYVDRIDNWLGEGIDIDPDGQFSERSVAVYSPICDNVFITVTRFLDRPHLLDVVRKNLDMTLYYIQPGGEVFTDASGRQDSTQIGYVARYYYAYRYMALKDKNPIYSAVCQLIEETMPERILRYLPELLEDPELRQPLPAPTKVPDTYAKRFAYSGVFRIRSGDADLSVVEADPTFLTFKKSKAVLQSLQIAAAFFGSRGQFASEDVEWSGRRIVMTRTHTHGYYQPFPKDRRTGDGDLEKLPREERAMSEVQTMDYRVDIREEGGEVSIDITIDGTPYVPVAVELCFRSGGNLTGTTKHKTVDQAYFIKDGMAQYEVEGDTITFGPGTTEHKWVEMRGMLPKHVGESVYLTGYTPFQHTLHLK